MSARVFNPLVMSEMRRVMRGGSHPDYTEGRQSPPDNASIERVRKRLFEPMDHAESKKYVEKQLAAQQEEASKRWNFDFKRGKPRPSSDGSYEWGPVNEVIPEAYALRRLPFLSKHADINTEDIKEDGNANTTTTQSSSSSSSSTSSSFKCNKQKQAMITSKYFFFFL